MNAFRRRKVKSAKTLGQRLEVARKRKKFTLEDVEEGTKIRVRYLRAIESDNYNSLPGPVYLSGFLSSYAEFLGLSPEEVVRQYKQERGIVKKLPNAKEFRASRELNELGFAMTPRTIIIVLVSIAALCLFGYIGWQVKRFSSPPPIEIVTPESDVTDKDYVVVEGYTAEAAEIEINGQKINVDTNGLFSQKIGLKRGVNSIEIKAKNRIGKETIKVLKIFADFAVPANPPASS